MPVPVGKVQERVWAMLNSLSQVDGTTAVLVRFAELSGEAALGPLPTPDVIAWRPTAIVIGSVLVVGVGYLLIRGKSEDDSDDEHAAPPGAVDVPTAG